VSDIFDYIQPDSLHALIRQYSEVLDIPVSILDEQRKVIFKHPEKSPRAKSERRELRIKDNSIGYISVPSSGRSPGAALDFIEQNLTEILSMGYEIDSLSGEVARNYEEMSLLWQLTSRLGVGLDSDKVCRVLADEAMKICPSRNVSILLLAETPSRVPKTSCIVTTKEDEVPENVPFFLPEVSLGEDAKSASMMALSAAHGLMGEVYKRKEPITICDVAKDERFEGFTFPIKRILVVPLLVEDDVIGAIVAGDKLDGEEFYSTEIRLIMSIATECAVSIKKALLYDEIHDMLFSTAEAFSLAMDAKDPYTYGHSKRVSELAAGIGESMGLPADTIGKVRLAALLHDIGKLGTPEVILGKISNLEPDEMEMMREHAYMGARMIENIKRMREISTWMCHHHEKFDGSGYPSGLKGEQIPLPSRIIALADYYDALTSDRPYRKALTKEDAINEMKAVVGKHFDPAVYEHFLKVTS